MLLDFDIGVDVDSAGQMGFFLLPARVRAGTLFDCCLCPFVGGEDWMTAAFRHKSAMEPALVPGAGLPAEEKVAAWHWRVADCHARH
jgi:hypothetical protein